MILKDSRLSYGFPAIHKNVYGFLWIPRDADGFPWIGNPRPENAALCNASVAQLNFAKAGSASKVVFISDSYGFHGFPMESHRFPAIP